MKPIGCPICPSTKKNNRFLKKKYDLGRHLCSLGHLNALSDLNELDRADFEAWKESCDGGAAVEHFMSHQERDRKRWANSLKGRGLQEDDLPAQLRNVAEQGVLSDVAQFGTYLSNNADTSTSAQYEDVLPVDCSTDYDTIMQDAGRSDHMPRSPQQEVVRTTSACSNRESACGGEESEVESNFTSDEDGGSESGSESGSRGDNGESSAEAIAGSGEEQAFGKNDYFESNNFFIPTQDSLKDGVEDPTKQWYPFKSRLDAILYTFCMNSETPFSQSQLKNVWLLLKMVLPSDTYIPSLRTIMKYRSIIPKPNIKRFEAEKGPYYQLSILDIIRMQFGLPEISCQEEPVVINATAANKPSACSELWHGSKWRFAPQLQKPLHIINSWNYEDETYTEHKVWCGDIVSYIETASEGQQVQKYAVFRGMETHVVEDVEIRTLQTIPLSPISGVSGTFSIPTKFGFPMLNEEVVHCVEEGRITGVFGLKTHEMVFGRDFESLQLHDLSAAAIQGLFGRHPLRDQFDLNGLNVPVHNANISVWNDATSAVSSNRYNPTEIWTISLSGLSHKVSEDFLSAEMRANI